MMNKGTLKMEKEKRPGYKWTKLGWLPEEWEITKLGDLGNLSSGTTPLRANHNKYFKGGAISWVKTTDLNNGIVTSTEESVTDVALKETSLKVLPQKTLLVAMYGGFNQIGRTGLLGIDATINQALSALVIKKKDVNPFYVLNWMNFNVGYWKRYAASSRKETTGFSKGASIRYRKNGRSRRIKTRYGNIVSIPQILHKMPD